MPLTKRNAIKKKLATKTNATNRTKKSLSVRAAPKKLILKRRRVRARISKGK